MFNHMPECILLVEVLEVLDGEVEVPPLPEHPLRELIWPENERS